MHLNFFRLPHDLQQVTISETLSITIFIQFGTNVECTSNQSVTTIVFFYKSANILAIDR